MGVADAVLARGQIDNNVTPSSTKHTTLRFINGQHLIW